MSRYPDNRPGRVVLDDRGNPVAEREVATGEFKSDIDTRKLRALRADDLKLLDTVRMRAAKFNPYDTAAVRPVVKATRRKTLDDLRRLSEEIKRTRQQAGGSDDE